MIEEMIIIFLAIGFILGAFFAVTYIGNGIIETHDKIKNICGKMFPYTNSTIEIYKSCINNPSYYGVLK